MWPKWTVRRPTPIPRSGRSQRLDIGVARACPAGGEPEREGATGGKRPWPSFTVDYFFSSFFTGTAQPPLPLQEFLPAHPLSPVLQPPWPLQSFFPAQSCLPLSFFSSSSLSAFCPASSDFFIDCSRLPAATGEALAVRAAAPTSNPLSAAA